MPTPPLLPLDPMDFTGLNRFQLLDRIQTLYRQVNSNWDDFSSNHPENLTLQGQTLIGSLLSGTLNERVRQTSWATVSDRLAAIRKGRPLGFELDGREAATVDGQFTLPNSAVASKKVLIPAGTRLRTGDEIFSTLVDMDIEIGNNGSITASVEHAVTESESFQSDETANIVLQLARYPVVDDSLIVTAGNGAYSFTDPTTSKKWQSFLEMGPDTLGCMALLDNNSKMYVLFGNAIHGTLPTGTIQVSYKVGGGVEGRVSSGASWDVLDTIYDDVGAGVTVLFNNSDASVGGTEEMSVEEARVRGPLAARTISSCVNEPDFEYVATKKGGLARAAFMTSNHDSSIQEDFGKLYLVAYGTAYTEVEGAGYYPPAAPTSAQIAAVEALIDTETGEHPGLMGVNWSILAALFYTVDVAVRLYKASSYTQAQVKASVSKELRKYFAVADESKAPLYNVNFGYKLVGADSVPDYELAWSNIFNVINDSPGVHKLSYADNNLLLNTVRASVTLSPAYFPVLGDIQIYDMDESGVEI